MDGTVTDPQGAAIVGAQIVVTDVNTGQPFRTTTNERGEWVIPAMPNGAYRVAVSMQGFKTTTTENVKMDAGVPQTVSAKLVAAGPHPAVIRYPPGLEAQRNL